MAFQIPSDLHPDCAPIVWLLGTWQGNGQGDYPTIEKFSFRQEAIFAHDGRPFFHYFSRTWLTDDEGADLRPGALETGFLRPRPDNQLELVMAQGANVIQTKSGHAHGGRDNPFGGRSLADPVFDRFWSICNEAGVRLAAHPDDPWARAVDYEAASTREVEPWFHGSVQMDKLRDKVEARAARRRAAVASPSAPSPGRSTAHTCLPSAASRQTTFCVVRCITWR